MDSNKDEALRCIGIAKEAIASGSKDRALKLIKIAQRLDKSLSIDELLEACDKINPLPGSSENENLRDRSQNGASSRSKGNVGEDRNYSEEHVKLIGQVNRSKDYYSILGLEKSCSMEEIRKAYRKLSLKVHPDKNKAPGSEDAFKKVSKAFKCLSVEDSRSQYDQIGLVDEYEHDQQHVRRRRGTATNDFYEDDFDPNEIFRSFFGQQSVFHSSHVFRTRGMHTQNRTNAADNAGGSSVMVLLQILAFFMIILLAYSPSWEPEYSLQKDYNYQIRKVTEQHQVEFFVKSADFDSKYPIGSESRANFEENVVHDYRILLRKYCQIEMQRRRWSRSIPTPHCDKLRNFGVA